MPVVFLGLGSNLGRREETLNRALHLLEPHLSDMRVSSLYETEPVGFLDQPRFLNAVCTGTTELYPAALLRVVLGVEASLGRERKERWGPRVIDIDILLYSDMVLKTEELTIPHPRLVERAFVLVPLVELAPEYLHPALGTSMTSLLAALSGVERDVRKHGSFDGDAG